MNKDLFNDSRSNKQLLEVQELFPNCDQSGHSSFQSFDPPSYMELVERLCDKVLFESSDNDYQGSTYCCLLKGDKYGYLEFGWGSCSGCDWLQSVDNYKDLQDLFDHLHNSVQWFDSKEEFLNWCLHEHDWEGSFSWYDGAQGFVKQVKAFFDE